jgi:hypothetical protein
MSTSEKLTWTQLEGHPRECARCGSSIAKLAEVGEHGVRLDDKGRVVRRFLRCMNCTVRRRRAA